jgi:RNA polymerase sigma factor (sigma-70 family)
MRAAADYDGMREGNRGRELERVLATHAAALARLAASYESRPALREELLQDIAFAVWRALPGFRGESSEKTFVMRIATNRALSHLAARSAEKGTLPSSGSAENHNSVEQLPDSMPRPDEIVARGQMAERLQRAVHALPLTLRQVMVLAFEGLGNEEIAEVLGIAPGNVGVRLHRGKAALKSSLGEPT